MYISYVCFPCTDSHTPSAIAANQGQNCQTSELIINSGRQSTSRIGPDLHTWGFFVQGQDDSHPRAHPRENVPLAAWLRQEVEVPICHELSLSSPPR